MSKDKGYKDTKEFICVGCGKTIVLTKFASQKTCKCEECKANNVPINPDIVAQALTKNPPKERHKAVSTGNTKERPCIQCGKMVTVSKFMSDAKVLCDECKGVSSSNTPMGRRIEIGVDMSKLDRSKIMPMEEYEVNQAIIANKRLRYVKCPACGHEHLKPILVLDWSIFGLVIQYQCPECKLLVNISEQAKRMINVAGAAKALTFDYTASEIKDLTYTHVEHGRVSNIIDILIRKLEENNIPIEDVEVPPYRYQNDRPVPVGYVIPPEDVWVKKISDALKAVENGDTVDATNKLKDILNYKEED